MDTSKALAIIPQTQINRMATAGSNAILAMLRPGLDALGHEGLIKVKEQTYTAIWAIYPNDPRDPFDQNGNKRRKQFKRLDRAIAEATIKIPIVLAAGARRVRQAEINHLAAQAELRTYQVQRELDRLKARDATEAVAAQLLAEDGAHQVAIAEGRQRQAHDWRMKESENKVPLEVTRMKTATEIEVAKVQARTEIEVATVKGYNEAQVAGFRTLITLLSAEKDPVKLGELFTHFLAAAAIIDQEREMHSPLYTTTTDQATGATITEMNTAEARYRSQAKHDDLRRIVDTWRKTIAKGG